MISQNWNAYNCKSSDKFTRDVYAPNPPSWFHLMTPKPNGLITHDQCPIMLEDCSGNVSFLKVL